MLGLIRIHTVNSRRQKLPLERKRALKIIYVGTSKSICGNCLLFLIFSLIFYSDCKKECKSGEFCIKYKHTGEEKCVNRRKFKEG